MKVLIHINDIDKWNTTISNSKNLIEDANEDLVLEVVVNGPAVKLLTKESSDILEESLKELFSNNVRVLACENALRSNEIKNDELIYGVGTVRAGVVEIAERQAEGFAYIKA